MSAVLRQSEALANRSESFITKRAGKASNFSPRMEGSFRKSPKTKRSLPKKTSFFKRVVAVFL